MQSEKEMITFGPVPSRRLGQSLGINNIPPKACPYSCVYCQVGRTRQMQTGRQEFYSPRNIMASVERRLDEAHARGESVDYLAFVPDGEPSLDSNLGTEIRMLKSLHDKVAVITNATLLWKEDVRQELSQADWVSVKVDAVSRDIWRKIDRPHKSLVLETVLDGIRIFSQTYKGILATETMLVSGINDDADELEKIAGFIAGLKARTSYISIPIRPPAENHVKPAPEHSVHLAYQVFTDHGIDTEYLIGYEGNAFAFTGNIKEDILSITSVHPIREDGMKELLCKADADWSVVECLTENARLASVEYRGQTYFMRTLPSGK